jgi:hypothetical protein
MSKRTGASIPPSDWTSASPYSQLSFQRSILSIMSFSQFCQKSACQPAAQRNNFCASIQID